MSKPLLNRKQAGLTVVLLTLTLSLVLFFPLQTTFAQNANDYYYKEFEWDYDGRHWTWNLSIPKALYEAYKNVPVSTRTRNGLEGYGFLTTTNDYYLKALAEKLNQTTAEMGYGSYDEVSFVLAFVQSLPYTSDSVTSGYDEYPRFPIETLVDDGGDCEDTAILFATLTLIMNYGTVYINPPNHYAVGILGNDLQGYYLTYQNKTYYYCETTGDGFKIGDMPEEFQNIDVSIYDIQENQQFTPNIQVIPPTEQPYQSATPTQPPVNPTATPTATTQPTQEPDILESLFDDTTFIIILIVMLIVVPIVAISIQKTKNQNHTQPLRCHHHPATTYKPTGSAFTADKTTGQKHYSVADAENKYNKRLCV